MADITLELFRTFGVKEGDMLRVMKVQPVEEREFRRCNFLRNGKSLPCILDPKGNFAPLMHPYEYEKIRCRALLAVL